MMITTIQPICGVQLGFELTEAEVDDQEIGYVLIDLLILRIQIAWYK
jgi:hypothetical protein